MREYVLVPADVYQPMRAIIEEDGLDRRQVANLVELAMRANDASNPSLESSQKYRSSP
jgi:hypothetical protein